MATAYDTWLEGDCGVDDAEEHRAEIIEELLAEYAEDDAKLREAEENIAGTFDGSHYTDVTLALYELANTPADKLAGSDLLARLYRLAGVEWSAMNRELRAMAEQDADEEIERLSAGPDHLEEAA